MFKEEEAMNLEWKRKSDMRRTGGREEAIKNKNRLKQKLFPKLFSLKSKHFILRNSNNNNLKINKRKIRYMGYHPKLKRQ